jgi:hypothetical protein
MDFKLITPKESEFIRAITFNKGEIEEYVKTRISKYEGRFYEEGQIKEAKADRADLNKFKEAMETRRKEIKAQHMLPYEKFAEDVAEIVASLNKPLYAHHYIVNSARSIKYRYDLRNGVSLCYACHRYKVHKTASFEYVGAIADMP